MVEFLEVRFTEVDVVFVATEFNYKVIRIPKLEKTIILWQIVSLNFKRSDQNLPGYLLFSNLI